MKKNINAEEIIHELPKGLLNWYDFHREGKVLCIANSDDCMIELLRERCIKVEVVSAEISIEKEFQNKYRNHFDYLVAIGHMEYLEDQVIILKAWRELLSKNGRLLIGADNRLGLRYFCGDRDPFTNRNFDGIENYKRIRVEDKKYIKGRNYSKDEILEFLHQSGFKYNKCYSVFPNLELPQLIYDQDYLPKEELGIRLFPRYHYPDTVFLQEEYLYTDLIKNGLFHSMANSFLFECSMDNTFNNISHVTTSMDRGKKDAVATIIRKNGTVEKRILYKEGIEKLQQLMDNTEDLKKHGLNVVEGEIVGNSYKMPYITADILMNHLRKLIRIDVDQFKSEVIKFCDIILQSSDHMPSQDDENNMGVILRRGYIDLVPLNCFYVSGEYLFFDQEFYIENYPANVIIYRAIEIIYMNDSEMEAIVPKQFFWNLFGLDEQLELWRIKANKFIINLRNKKEMRIFNERHESKPEIIHTNRQRMNYSLGDYQRIFVDIFKNVQNKKIILFGSGNFTKRFLIQFKKDYNIYAIVDNDEAKWGSELDGIAIRSPEILWDIPKEERRIIICIKNYTSIVFQLQQMGFYDYCIYDTNVEYQRKEQMKIVLDNETNYVSKKYHIGYIAGVFDLFHIGHLNMFRRAKEQCEYLIVGVVTDEGVRTNKETEPFIPFEERLEIVNACKYVDEAVKIPFGYAGTRDAYNMYHFDVQFSGSDYINNPNWLAEKAFLEKNGAELVFFPYTESTSSTKLKKVISSVIVNTRSEDG